MFSVWQPINNQRLSPFTFHFKSTIATIISTYTQGCGVLRKASSGDVYGLLIRNEYHHTFPLWQTLHATKGGFVSGS
jgi:hypothetical protein